MQDYITNENERDTVCNIPRENMNGKGELKRLAILIALKKNGDMTTSGILSVTTLESSDVSYHIPNLEDKGYITVSRRKSDETEAKLPSIISLNQSGEQKILSGDFGSPNQLKNKTEMEILREKVANLSSQVESISSKSDSKEDNEDFSVKELAEKVDFLMDRVDGLEDEMWKHEKRICAIRPLLMQEREQPMEELNRVEQIEEQKLINELKRRKSEGETIRVYSYSAWRNDIGN